MKAIVVHAYGGPEVLRYEEKPDPIPGAGEVLVRVAATSVNPVDIIGAPESSTACSRSSSPA
jgi:NADPH2:quinone reductase